MEVIHPRCAGIDISKKDAKVCVRVQGRGSRPTTSMVTTWGAMTEQILDLNAAVARNESDTIRQALDKAGSNRAAAAKLLNIPRTTLYYKMEQYGLKTI